MIYTYHENVTQHGDKAFILGRNETPTRAVGLGSTAQHRPPERPGVRLEVAYSTGPRSGKSISVLLGVCKDALRRRIEEIRKGYLTD